MNTKQIFLIVLTIVIFGESFAEVMADVMPYLIGAGCATIFCLVVYSIFKRQAR